MQRIPLLTWLIFSATLTMAQATQSPADTAKADAAITNATVYFGYGAELSHETKIRINSTTRVIVINQLSTNIDINSLQISCPENVALLSHKYSVFTPPPAAVIINKEAEKLGDSVKILLKETNRLDNLILIEEETLTKTGTLIESTVANNGSKPLSSTEVLKLVDYYTAKIEKSKTTIFNYRQNKETINNHIQELRKRITLLNSNPVPAAKPYGQLILQVMCNKAEEIPVSLSYYTTNAGWTPLYDIRVNSKTNKVKLVYKASLTQTSGIDWKRTRLTLSTGTPNFGVSAPVLLPWYLQLYVPELYKALQGRAAGVNFQRNMIQSMADDKMLSEVVVAQKEGYAVQKPEETIDPSTVQQFTTLNEGQLNTNFEIDLPYDIESDGELHSVTIKNEEIQCVLKNYGVPRIDKEAYLLAEVADWQNLDLLPGDANIIMDDTYIGKSVIDPNSTGRDKRIVIKRSLVKELSSLKTSGKDSKQAFTYEILLKNNKLTDVNLLLKDQFPLSTIKEVEVKLEDNGEAMVNEETGVLTWKVSLKPGESRKFRFTYTVKYPKDKKIINLK